MSYWWNKRTRVYESKIPERLCINNALNMNKTEIKSRKRHKQGQTDSLLWSYKVLVQSSKYCFKKGGKATSEFFACLNKAFVFPPHGIQKRIHHSAGDVKQSNSLREWWYVNLDSWGLLISSNCLDHTSFHSHLKHFFFLLRWLQFRTQGIRQLMFLSCITAQQ